jgi:thioredoxin-like negative regulator of GroEL
MRIGGVLGFWGDAPKYNVYKFDIENDMELMREMGVRAVPTIKIFKEGAEVFSRPGVMQPAEVLELLN